MKIYLFLLILFIAETFARYSVKKEKFNVMIFDTCLYSDDKRHLYGKIMILFDFTLLFVLAVFRDINIGTDFVTYMEIFHGMANGALGNVSDDYFWSKGEFGFALIGTLIGNVFNEPFWIVCVCYLIILGGVYRFIKKYSMNILLSTFLFLAFSFYNMSFNILRQYIAAVILLKAIDYINKSFKKFLLVVLLATVFHKSAIIFLVLFPVVKYVKNIRYGSLIFLILMGGIAFMPEFALTFFGDALDYDTYVSEKESGGAVNTVVMGSIFLLFLVFSNELERKDVYGRVWIALATVAFSVSMFSIQIHSFNRLLLYFLMPAMVTIVNFVNVVLSTSSVKWGEFIIMIVFSVYYISLLTYTTVYQTVPYGSKILGL